MSQPQPDYEVWVRLGETRFEFTHKRMANAETIVELAHRDGDKYLIEQAQRVLQECTYDHMLSQLQVDNAKRVASLHAGTK
jgi:hypothetical protein